MLISDTCTFRNQHGAVWWCNTYYMAFLRTPALNARIASWKSTCLIAEYHYPNGKVCKQFSIPPDKLESTIELLKLDDQIPLL